MAKLQASTCVATLIFDVWFLCMSSFLTRERTENVGRGRYNFAFIDHRAESAARLYEETRGIVNRPKTGVAGMTVRPNAQVR